MKQQPNPTGLNIVLKFCTGVLLSLLFSILFASCITLEKSIDKVTENPTNAKLANQAIKDKWEQVIASNCAAWYTIQESTETETETITGNSEQLKQELKLTQQELDSLKLALNNIPVKPECEPEVKARDNIIKQLQSRIQALNTLADNLKADIQRVTTTKTQESNAKARDFQLQLQAQQDSTKAEQARHKATKQILSETKEKANTYFWGLIIAGLVVAGIMVLKFFKPF